MKSRYLNSYAQKPKWKGIPGLERYGTYRAIHSPFTLNGMAFFQGCTGD